MPFRPGTHGDELNATQRKTFRHAGQPARSVEYMDLLHLLKRPESKTLEFKRDLSSPDGALRTIVAFANAA